jgi:mortality factor 4-like protein 1
MASESKTTPDTMFPVNGRVLCYHGQHIYEAKVLQNQWFYEKAPLTSITGAHYFVHYKGWKQTLASPLSSRRAPFCSLQFIRWDEWVPESRVLEYNDTNLVLQKKLRKEASAATSAASKAPKGAKDGGGGSTRGTRKDGPRGTKRGRDEVPLWCALLSHRCLTISRMIALKSQI